MAEVGFAIAISGEKGVNNRATARGKGIERKREKKK